MSNRTETQQVGESREAFMTWVRAALGRAGTEAPAEPPPAHDGELMRMARAGDDLMSLFVKNAAATGMKVERLASRDVVARLVELLGELNAKSVIIGAGSFPGALALRDTLRRRDVAIVDWAAAPGMDRQFDVDAGITDVHAAIAETGSLVCCSDGGHSRGLSLIPPVHIAIVRKSDILPDMFDFWPRYAQSQPDELPSSIAFITGPSKTADIEGVLITGVHGPGRVFVLVVEDA